MLKPDFEEIYIDTFYPKDKNAAIEELKKISEGNKNNFDLFYSDPNQLVFENSKRRAEMLFWLIGPFTIIFLLFFTKIPVIKKEIIALLVLILTAIAYYKRFYAVNSLRFDFNSEKITIKPEAIIINNILRIKDVNFKDIESIYTKQKSLDRYSANYLRVYVKTRKANIALIDIFSVLDSKLLIHCLKTLYI